MKLALALVALPAIALAQTATTGAVDGVVSDARTHQPLPGTTIVVTSPVLATVQTAIADDQGCYKIIDLPPGAYDVTFYYNDKTLQRTTTVKVGQAVKLDQAVDTDVSIDVTTRSRCYDCGPSGPVPVVKLPAPATAQVQADLGLAVVGLAYEQPLGDHYAVQFEAQAFSTYFAPWFSAGDRVDGFGGQLRPTWFRDVDHHGLYVAPYLRIDRVTHDMAAGVGFAAGAFAGYAFGAGPLDIRIGGGAQYMRYFAGPFGLSTPFVALDLVVGYRL